MPAARIARRNACNLQRNDIGVQHRHDPAHRPHKPLRLRRTPVHVFGPVKPQHFFRQLGCKNLRRRPPDELHRRADVLALRRLNFLYFRNGNACLFRKGLGRRRRRAVFEGNHPRRAHDNFFVIGLLGLDAFRKHRQPPRRGEGRDLRVLGHQPLALQQFAHALAQLGLGRGNHPRRNLFEPDL